MYHPVKVCALSSTQKSNLMKGKGIRMKSGTAHTIPMRPDQLKKMYKNHSKGMATTIALDPYAIQELHGSGFFDSIKSAFSHPVTKAISKTLRPVATNMARSALSSFGPMGEAVGNALIDVADKEAESRGYGIKKKVGRPRKYVHHDKRIGAFGNIIEPAMLKKTRGKGMFGDIMKASSKALRPVATNFLRSKLADRGGILGAVGNVGLDLANQFAESKGYGVKKRRGRPPKKGGALIAAGYGGH
jgi:hypothetical protein